MNTLLPSAGIAILAILAIPACNKEDPKLVEKRLQQEIQIKELNGELALLNEKINNLPTDVTPQLKEAQETLEDKTKEAERLEAELAKLAKEKESLENDIKDYKEKYPVRP